MYRPLGLALLVLLSSVAGCVQPDPDADSESALSAAATGDGTTRPVPERAVPQPVPVVGLESAPLEVLRKPRVVVATLDTGANLFHPAWRRDAPAVHPSTFLDGYPAAAPALPLAFGSDLREDVEASADALALLRKEREFPYWVPGTNIVGMWAHPEDQRPVFDTAAILRDRYPSHAHGAMASSQIAGLEFGLATDVYVVIMDRTTDGSYFHPYEANAEGLRWAADQPWIDIIHTNMQNPMPLAREDTNAANPMFPGYVEALKYAISKGKLVVSAGGNFWAEPTETSPHAGLPGVLVAGANDNCGYTDFSNPDPHVVMDGYVTDAAASDSYKKAIFGGTSSASPRVTGYAAQLLLEVRRAYGLTGGMEGDALVELPADVEPPASGPLADGRLTAAELHEVIRKTADPNPHESRFDGGASTLCVPQPTRLPAAFYPKMGYGEVSEHTLPDAVGVLLGEAAMPERPVEDAYFEASEAVRRAAWD